LILFISLESLVLMKMKSDTMAYGYGAAGAAGVELGYTLLSQSDTYNKYAAKLGDPMVRLCHTTAFIVPQALYAAGTGLASIAIASYLVK
jgi:hypothetical protein